MCQVYRNHSKQNLMLTYGSMTYKVLNREIKVFFFSLVCFAMDFVMLCAKWIRLHMDLFLKIVSTSEEGVR